MCVCVCVLPVGAQIPSNAKEGRARTRLRISPRPPPETPQRHGPSENLESHDDRVENGKQKKQAKLILVTVVMLLQ